MLFCSEMDLHEKPAMKISDVRMSVSRKSGDSVFTARARPNTDMSLKTMSKPSGTYCESHDIYKLQLGTCESITTPAHSIYSLCTDNATHTHTLTYYTQFNQYIHHHTYMYTHRWYNHVTRRHVATLELITTVARHVSTMATICWACYNAQKP